MTECIFRKSDNEPKTCPDSVIDAVVKMEALRKLIADVKMRGYKYMLIEELEIVLNRGK
jgi:hypothetical protein